MNAVREDVSALVAKELESANEKFPLFASHHEAYGVIKEEYEECADELLKVQSMVSQIWSDTRDNRTCLYAVKLMREYAINLAVEAIQVAAMCDKYVMSFLMEQLEDKLAKILEREINRIGGK